MIPPSRVLTFKLGGKETLPNNASLTLYDPPARLTEDSDIIAKGRTLYHTYCHRCHGQEAVSNGAVPDLRHLQTVFHDNFNKIVLEGLLEKAGMVSFGDVLTKDDAYAIHAYILDRANIDKELREQSGWWVNLKTSLFSGVAKLIAKVMDKL